MRNLLSLSIVVSLVGGCPSSQTIKNDLKAGENLVADCTKAEWQPLLAALTPTMVELFTGKTPTWGETTDQLVGMLGDVGKCAANEGLAALEDKLSHVKVGMAANTKPLANARKYMAAKGWKLKTK